MEEELDLFSDGGDVSLFFFLIVLTTTRDDDDSNSGSLGLPSSPSIEGLDSEASPTPELIK